MLIYELLEAGIRAPSGDNLQPWAFILVKGEAKIFIDTKIDQSFFNFRQCASLISAGALVENLLYAAQFLRCESNFELKMEKNNRLWQVGIFQYQPATLSNRNRKQEFKKTAIFKRCTNRKPYKKGLLEKELLREFEASLKELPVSLHVFQGKEQEKFSQLIYKADIIRVERKDLHLFLHNTIRWSTDEIIKKRDGMPIETLEAGKTGEIFLKLTKPWPIMHFLNNLGASKVLADYTRKLALSSAALLVLSVEKFDEKAFFYVGQAMEKIWLRAIEKGFAIQPLAALPLFKFRWQKGDKFSFAPRHQKIMMEIEKDCQSLGIPHCAMILRIGRADLPKILTPRKPLESFLLKKYD